MPKSKKGRHLRQLAPRFHIFCEGEKTEPNYLNGYIGRKCPGSVLIKVEKRTKNTPVEMVEEALEAQREAPEGDEFWVVYDRESAIRYPDTLHAEARQKAGDKVHIALSNVCFEVWLLLHFQPHAAAYNSCEDLLKRSALKKKHIKNYDKANRREYSDTEIASARTNAEKMNAQTEAAANPGWKYPHQWNPYTSVHKLLDAIDSFAKQHIRTVR